MLGALRTESADWLRLDMLRFVSAACIVWHHSRAFYVPRADRGTFDLGWELFVDLFFIISGVIISAVYADRLGDAAATAKFFCKRIARLIPLHWLVLIVTIAFWQIVIRLGLPANDVPDMSVECIAHNTLLLNAISSCGNGVAITGVTWSIGIEMILYLLFPFISLLGMRKGALETATALAIVTLLVSTAGKDVTEAPNVIRGLAGFLFGAALYKHRHVLRGGSVLPIVLAMLLLSVFLEAPEHVILALIYATAFTAVAGDAAKITTPLWVASLAPWGALTYSIYMWHSLFILIVMNGLADKFLQLPPLAMIPVGVFCYAAILVWSYLSWVYFETPARKLIDGMGRRVTA